MKEFLLKLTYKPNLYLIINILKFAFASAIVVHHTEQYRSACGIENFWQNPTIISLGKTSIVFFFVLSGFLVTNSIINNDFNIKEFYKKRFLRIAPLYYILVLCSIFIFPNILNISYQANVHQTILYLFFLLILQFLFFLYHLHEKS